jgi:glycosyltransferase involved in cell wall biosynthesis
MESSQPVVYVTATFPWPSSGGGHIRTASNLLALASLRPTHLAAFPTVSADLEGSGPLASVLIKLVEQPGIAKRLSYRIASSARGGHPYMERFRRSGGLVALRRLIDEVQPSVVVLEYPFYPSVVRALAGAGRRFIADVADDRISVARQIVTRGARPATRVRALFDLPVLARSERTINQLDQVWFASQSDVRRARLQFPALDVRMIPNVIDQSGLGDVERPPPHPYSAAFLGSFEYPPNEHAALRFARAIAPLLRRRKPDARLGLIGLAPTPSVRAAAAANDIALHANVPDAAAILAHYAVLVVPLAMGSGTRLKILEALAAGIPVVTTSLGMAGLELEPGRHLLVADDDESLADAVVHLWESPDEAARLIEAGRHAVRARYSTEVLRCAISDALSSLES